jgi:hypothetical protein
LRLKVVDKPNTIPVPIPAIKSRELRAPVSIAAFTAGPV